MHYTILHCSTLAERMTVTVAAYLMQFEKFIPKEQSYFLNFCTKMCVYFCFFHLVDTPLYLVCSMIILHGKQVCKLSLMDLK